LWLALRAEFGHYRTVEDKAEFATKRRHSLHANADQQQSFKVDLQPMQPTIRLEPVHMYCQLLVYEDSLGQVEAIVEYAVNGNLILWENDFECSPERRSLLIAEARRYMHQRGRECDVAWGQSRIPPMSTNVDGGAPM
jgi:hypothetical protein